MSKQLTIPLKLDVETALDLSEVKELKLEPTPKLVLEVYTEPVLRVRAVNLGRYLSDQI